MSAGGNKSRPRLKVTFRNIVDALKGLLLTRERVESLELDDFAELAHVLDRGLQLIQLITDFIAFGPLEEGKARGGLEKQVEHLLCD